MLYKRYLRFSRSVIRTISQSIDGLGTTEANHTWNLGTTGFLVPLLGCHLFNLKVMESVSPLTGQPTFVTLSDRPTDRPPTSRHTRCTLKKFMDLFTTRHYVSQTLRLIPAATEQKDEYFARFLVQPACPPFLPSPSNSSPSLSESRPKQFDPKMSILLADTPLMAREVDCAGHSGP